MTTDRKILAAIENIPLHLEQVRSELAVGLQTFHNGNRLQGARAVQVGVTGASTLAWAGAGRLVGWSLRATGGAVTVMIRDARTAADDFLACIELADSASETIWLGEGGVSFGEGVYVQATAAGAGVIQGAVYLGAVD